MFPSFSINNTSYRRLTDSEPSRQCPCRKSALWVKFSNLQNNGFRQFGVSMLLTFTSRFWMGMRPVVHTSGPRFRMLARAVAIAPRLSVLARHICHVVSVGTAKQMCWVHAPRTIARVASHARWLSVCEKIRDSGSAKISALKRKYTVWFRWSFDTSDPIPTFIRQTDANVRPESCKFFLRKCGDRFRIVGSQEVNLLDRFSFWLGSFGVQPSFEPFVLYRRSGVMAA